MFCIQCGKPLPEGARFCPECGTAVSQPAGFGQRPGVTVDQHVQTNEGQVVGLAAGKGALQGGLNADISQDVGVVKDGGAVVGAVLGGEGPVHVGGQQFYGEVVQGDKTEVNTGGGAYVGGSVTTGGEDFVGRDRVVHGGEVHGDKVGGDKIAVGDVSGQVIAIGRGAQASVTTGIGGAELAALFAPILQAAQSVSPEKRDQAVQAAEQLQAEVAKGSKADDEKVGDLVEGLVELVPGAVSAVATAFGSPLLAGVAGPITNFVLKRLGVKL